MNSDKKKVMIVDDNITNLTACKVALAGEYAVLPASSGEKMLKLLERVKPDLFLLDVEMPDMNGYEVIKIIKNNPELADIPVIFLTAMSDFGNELEGLSLGAVDYITKPFSPPLLVKRIGVHLQIEAQKQVVKEQKQQLEYYVNNLEQMVEAKTHTIMELQNAIFSLLSEVVEYRDYVTGGHVARTAVYIELMIEELLKRGIYADEISGWDRQLVVLSSQLHDIGKVAIRDNILLKPGKLTPEEFEEMKKHTTYGAKMIERIENNTTERKFIEHAKIMALSHHEWWNGRGYPCSLESVSIPLQGRIMAVADVYDALITARPYKEAFTHKQAVEIIGREAGTHFDPQIAGVFADISGAFENILRK
ncbi:MAG: response regulator [Deferribacteraceae bacterium]|jgi:putative two-component system response regulator|nr:response regulator [Deferribacteraceae bacterium]